MVPPRKWSDQECIAGMGTGGRRSVRCPQDGTGVEHGMKRRSKGRRQQPYPCRWVGGRSLNSVERAQSYPVTLQGAMLLLCGRTTRTKHEDRDLESDLTGWTDITSRNRDVEMGMQRYCMYTSCSTASVTFLCETNTTMHCGRH